MSPPPQVIQPDPVSRDEPPCLISGVAELRSLGVLSFAAGRCCVLLNGEWLLQLQWQQVGEEPQTVSCCSVPTTAGVHHCVCRDTLFTLSAAGLICILHTLTDIRV